MGTINYFTSKYVTVGLQPYDYEECYNDYMEICEDEEFVSDMMYNYIADIYEENHNNIQLILDKYTFEYFHVTIKPGYYEGFSIDIENNYPCFYDNYSEKREALKEATQLKLFLLECVDNGLCVLYPSWRTSYLDYTDSVKEIKQAIKDIKQEIKYTIPTYYQYVYNIPIKCK